MPTEEEIALTRAIGARLRAARIASGLTLSQLSVRVGGTLSKWRIHNYELGLRRMSVEGARLLAKALATTPAYLLGIDNPYELGEDEKALVLAYRGASEADRARLLEIAMSVAGDGARSARIDIGSEPTPAAE